MRAIREGVRTVSVTGLARLAAAAAGVVVSVLAVGCGPPDAAERAVEAGEPVAGGTGVVGMRSDFAGFNSITNTALYTDEVIKYALFTPLIQYDDELEPRPYLAESWRFEGDTAVVFRLRDDVFWHDGERVTAEDVAFTFELAVDPATASLLGSAYLSEVESATVVDPRTIRFDFARPHAQAIEDFWWAPMPEHLLADVPPAELRNAAFNRDPVGSGPYRFVEWRTNDRLVVERDPDFPEGLGGPPNLDRVVFRIVPEPATLLTELVTGGLDVDIPVEPTQVNEVRQAAGLTLHSFTGRTFYYIGWNNVREPFTDADVRRAMTLAIDRREIIEALLEGYGAIATGPIPPWSPLDPDVEPLSYDPERAAELLESAGWVDRDGDGVREDEAGRPFRFELLTSDLPRNRAVIEAVQAQLRRVGVAVEVRILEFQTLLAQHRGRDFDAVFSSWILDNFQVASAPMALFHSRWADVPGSANRSGFADPRADALIEAGAGETDPEAAREAWRELVELLQEEQPFTFMFWFEELAASRDAIRGVEMDPRGELVSIADWWLVGGAR
ncbi:MAG: ABC transporter substrate-binding protein [Gemmatimonadota bacterium]